MKARFILAAALTGALSVASAAYAQDTPAQQNAQPPAASQSTSEYGGVSGSSTAMGPATRSDWMRPATCGHQPRCNPNTGH